MSAWMRSAASRCRTPGRSAPACGERAGDLALALVSLVLVVGEQCRRRRIRAGRAGEDAVDVAAPSVDGDGDGGEPGEQLLGVSFGEQASDRRSLLDRQGLIVAGDGHVEQCLEDPELRGEQPVHGRRGHVGAVADGVDRRRLVAALEEEVPGCVDDGSAGETGAGLAALDTDGHRSDTNTVESRVKLSFSHRRSDDEH